MQVEGVLLERAPPPVGLVHQLDRWQARRHDQAGQVLAVVLTVPSERHSLLLQVLLQLSDVQVRERQVGGVLGRHDEHGRCPNGDG